MRKFVRIIAALLCACILLSAAAEENLKGYSPTPRLFSSGDIVIAREDGDGNWRTASSMGGHVMLRMCSARKNKTQEYWLVTYIEDESAELYLCADRMGAAWDSAALDEVCLYMQRTDGSSGGCRVELRTLEAELPGTGYLPGDLVLVIRLPLETLEKLFELPPEEEAAPTVTPTATAAPTEKVTAAPTTVRPAVTPTYAPTATPAEIVTATPTARVTATPTAKVTATPTARVTATPTAKATNTPAATGCNHDYSSIVCYDDDLDLHGKYCTLCGQWIDLTGHTFVCTQNIEPTCTSAGMKVNKCTVCGYMECWDYDPNGHSYGDWEDYGIQGHTRRCTVCGANSGLEAHDLQSYAYIEPTCVDEGGEGFICMVCYRIEIITYSPTGHTPAYDGHTQYCTVCGEVLDMSDHQYEWTVSSEPTCEEAGEEVGVCMICFNEEYRSIPATGHSYVWKYYDFDRDGQYCSKCGTWTNLTPHSWAYTVNEEATCTSGGFKVGHCTVCGCETTEESMATGHSYGAWYDIEPTDSGYTQKRDCAVCGASEYK